MGELKERFFGNPIKGIVTVVSLVLMLLFVVFIGPEITGSTVFIHPEQITLSKENPCEYVYHKEVCLTKVFNPSLQDDPLYYSAYLTVDMQGAQKTSDAPGKFVGTIKYGTSKTINDLVIKVTKINMIENSVNLEVIPYNAPQVQKTGLEDLWYPFIKNQKHNAIIISDNQDAIKQLREILKPELSNFEIIDSFKPGEVPDKYKATNQILIGVVSEHSLIREQLVDQGLDPQKFLGFDQGYIHLIMDPTKTYQTEGKNVGPQAILIITGESQKGLQKSIDALRNKDALVGTSIQI